MLSTTPLDPCACETSAQGGNKRRTDRPDRCVRPQAVHRAQRAAAAAAAGRSHTAASVHGGAPRRIPGEAARLRRHDVWRMAAALRRARRARRLMAGAHPPYTLCHPYTFSPSAHHPWTLSQCSPSLDPLRGLTIPGPSPSAHHPWTLSQCAPSRTLSECSPSLDPLRVLTIPGPPPSAHHPWTLSECSPSWTPSECSLPPLAALRHVAHPRRAVQGQHAAHASRHCHTRPSIRPDDVARACRSPRLKAPSREGTLTPPIGALPATPLHPTLLVQVRAEGATLTLRAALSEAGDDKRRLLLEWRAAFERAIAELPTVDVSDTAAAEADNDVSDTAVAEAGADAKAVAAALRSEAIAPELRLREPDTAAPAAPAPAQPAMALSADVERRPRSVTQELGVPHASDAARLPPPPVDSERISASAPE
jgi:hypothetical protein